MSASKPKVFIILDTIEVGGPGKGILQYCEYKPAYIDVTLGNFDYGKREHQTFNDRAEKLGVPLLKIRQKNKFDFSFINDLVNYITKEKIGLIQSHNFKSHFVASRVAQRAGIPWLAFAHGWTAETARVHAYNVWDKIQLRKAAHIVAVSGELKRTLTKYGIPPEKVSVIHNAVEVSDRSFASRNPRSKTWLLLCVGRLSFEKGQDVLLKALSLADLQVDWRLDIIGAGPMMTELLEIAADLGIASKVRFLGYLDDVHGYYDEADLLVAPSRREGVPNAILEAMAAGTPVLATSVGGVPEIIEHEKTGWLVECEVDKIAAQLKRLSEQIDCLAIVGMKASDSVRKGNDPKRRAGKIAQAQIDLLQNVIRTSETGA